MVEEIHAVRHVAQCLERIPLTKVHVLGEASRLEVRACARRPFDDEFGRDDGTAGRPGGRGQLDGGHTTRLWHELAPILRDGQSQPDCPLDCERMACTAVTSPSIILNMCMSVCPL